MGHRTVLALSNDYAHKWQKDPLLGEKIWSASSELFVPEDKRRIHFEYGQIIEQVHADCQTLIVADGYGGKAVAHAHWHRGQTNEGRDLALLKELADKLGYRVVKKSIKA